MSNTIKLNTVQAKSYLTTLFLLDTYGNMPTAKYLAGVVANSVCEHWYAVDNCTVEILQHWMEFNNSINGVVLTVPNFKRLLDEAVVKCLDTITTLYQS